MDSKFSRDEGSGLVDVRALAEQTLAARPKTEPKPDDHDLIPFSALTAFPSMPMQPMLVPIVEKKMPGWVWGVVGGGVAATVAVVVVLFVRPGPVVSTTEPQPGTATPAKVVTAGLATGMGTETGAAAGAQKAPDSTATTAATVDTKTADTKAADSKATAATTKTPDAKGAATAAGDHAAVKKETRPVDKAAHDGETKGKETKATAAATTTKKNGAPAEKAQPIKEATSAVAVKEGPPASKKEKPASSGDEDLRNLLGLDTETKKPEARAAAATANLPDQLSSGDIRTGMGSLKSRIDGCFSQYKVPGTVTVSTTIGGDGKVQSAKASGALAGSQEADCVTTVVNGARFKKFSGSPMSITYPFILR